MDVVGSCPLRFGELLDEYFIEHRTRVLDLAAFFDRLDRAADGPGADARHEVLREALRQILEPGPDRVMRVQLLLSDPTSELLPALDRKSAVGMYDPRIEEERR